MLKMAGFLLHKTAEWEGEEEGGGAYGARLVRLHGDGGL
jgi:hypothetical protein